MNSPRDDRLGAALIALALFAVYALSAPRTVMMEDDGNFILSSYFLGVAHPPGYPLYTALGWLAAQVPLGSVAYRVHLLSALFGAASCAALWLCARRLLESWLAAALAALALGLSPAFWSQAIVAEVYTLNTLFAFALLYLALRGGPLWAMALFALWRLTLLPLAGKLLSALSEGLVTWFPDQHLSVDLDRIPALAEDRERLWSQIGSAEFLSAAEKRAMLGLAPQEQGNKS